MSSENITKTPYFNGQNLDAVTESWIRESGDDQKKQTFHPSKALLLILDMQRIFLDPHSHAFIPSAPSIIPRIGTLASQFIEKGRPVILTRHINTEDNAGLMSQWWHKLISEEDANSHIISEFSSLKSPLMVKTQYDAFYHTNLESILKEKSVTQIVITGVMTHLCCESTARSAFIRGLMVFFPVDGTATYNVDFHRASLLNLSHGFANITCIPELSRVLERWTPHV